MTRHLFQCGKNSKCVSNFIRFHHYDACTDGWQTAAYTEELFPVFSDTNSYILMDESGECRGLYSRLDSLASVKQAEFDSQSMRASSVFSMLTTHGVLRSDGELFFKWIPRSIKDKIYNCKIVDIHGSDWMLACITRESNTIFIVDVSIDSCIEIRLNHDVKYCYTNKGKCYIIGREGIWRNSSLDGQDLVLIHGFKSKNKRIIMHGRSNNYMVVSVGEETVIFADEDVLPLDIKVRRCYTFPKCMVLETERGIFFSSTRADSNIASCISELFSEAGHDYLRHQTMIDPVLTVMAGKKECVKDLAGIICAYRKSSLHDDGVAFLLRNEPEFLIERMSRNEQE